MNLKQFTKTLPTIEEELPNIKKRLKNKRAEQNAEYYRKNKDKIAKGKAEYGEALIILKQLKGELKKRLFL